ncbi:MAG: hypothetical protein AAF529_12830, partial [Pseudomonadota bacterium]
DEIARKFGFRGALVPGVAIYGHLSWPLVNRFGTGWLAQSVDNLRLLKPAYHDDQLTISLSDLDDGSQQVHCHNQLGELLATLHSQSKPLPDPEDLSLLSATPRDPARVEIAWDTITPHQPFEPWQVQLNQADNASYTDQVADTQDLYQKDLVHPHWLLSLANTALTRQYIMPTWIHVGSETRHRAALHIDDTITIKSVPLEKWQKKGHEFIRIWVTFWRGEELTTDILHTAIFKVAS